MSRFMTSLLYENGGARSEYEERSRQTEDCKKLKQALRKERDERIYDQKKFKLELQKLEKENVRQRNHFQDKEKKLVSIHDKKQALMQSRYAESMACSLNQSDTTHLAVVDCMLTTAMVVKDQGNNLETVIKKQGEASTVRQEERVEDLEQEIKDQVKTIRSETLRKMEANLKKAEAMSDALEQSLKEHVTDKFYASEEKAWKRHEIAQNNMLKHLQIITTKASEVENAIVEEIRVEAHGAKTRADNRQLNMMDQLMWNSKSIETQNQAIKELSTHLTRPKGCSLFCLYVDRYSNRGFDAITTRCLFKRKRQHTEPNELLEQSLSEQNSVVILYGRRNLSKKIAGGVQTLFTQQNFAVPQPTAYHDDMPSCRHECQCPWLVVYAILQEDQSTKLLSEAIKRIAAYLSNPNVQPCSKLVIVQCKWLPGGDLMTSLRALRNTTAIVVQMRDYHTQVVEKAFATKSSFGEVVNMLKMDAKVRPRTLLKDDKD